METPARNAAFECAISLGMYAEKLRQDIRANPAYDGLDVDAATMGIVLLLCSTLMTDRIWEERRSLFDCYGSAGWPDSVTVRQRIEEFLDGVNVRADHWNTN